MTEHVKHYVALMCDAPGCLGEVSAYTIEEMQTVRATAALIGWTQDGKKDYCPTHSKEAA